ncbi:barstar family protein [Streptomyces rubiginosohelvolus]|uniref:barstar family protein n=1 Tax=Streptomyces rubiginosohelvolus TaxID=67362 RepID=UPI0033A5D07A
MTLSTAGRVDKESFFSAVRQSLPLDPPLESSRSWDALSDSLWEGLHAMGERKLTLVWVDAGVVEVGDEEDLKIALHVLRDLAESLSDIDATVGEPTELSVYVAVAPEAEPIARRLLDQQ